MSATFKTEEFREMIGILMPTVPARSPKACLHSVHFKVSEESAVASVTNLEQYLSVVIPCQCPGASEFAVRADKLYAILKTCQSETVTIKATNNGVEIRSGKSKWKLPTENPDEFPQPQPMRPESVSFEVDSLIFKPAIKRTAIASDWNATQKSFAMQGVLLSRSGNCAMLSATDGKMLACVKVGVQGDGDFYALMPASATKLIERALPADGTISVKVSSTDAQFSCGNVTAWTRLMEGRLPNIERWFEQCKANVSTNISSASFVKTIQQVALATSEESVGVNMRLRDGSIFMDSKSAGSGEANAEMPIPYDGEEVYLRVDPKFVLELLRSIGDVTVDLGLVLGKPHPDGTPMASFMLLRVNDFRFAIAAIVVEQVVEEPEAVAA